ncbi:MAG TPA: helix-turn-helix domain-containing protein [Candidatus Paceibacterota bacterium]|nr:helix-turn-helix domain-containing protein [Candidatus Paceibacterota bacterium]
MVYVQKDLLPREAPEKVMAFFQARLPHNELLSVVDVAAACNISVQTVRNWIDAELVEAVNVGSGDRPFWKVYRPSVLRHMERKVNGGEA